ncbi:MAG: hypothetical protein NUV91_06205 [Candidatus Omnitrophica bacterium]|nr:hypothetical protein [Candidatus Omnitrophota bacterium]
MKNETGLTFVELLMATAILALTMGAILVSYLRCIELSEMARNTAIAVQSARSKMEEIKSTDFTQIRATFDNTGFAVTGMSARGAIDVDDTNAEMLKISVDVSWKQKNGRLLGEDQDLDGAIDAGEDVNNNGILDSPVQIVTHIAQLL